MAPSPTLLHLSVSQLFYSLTHAALRYISENIFVIEDILILNFSVVETRSHVAQDGLEFLITLPLPPPPPPPPVLG